MSDPNLAETLGAIRTHLPGIAFCALLVRESDSWRVADRRAYDGSDEVPLIPGDSVLDYAARRAHPTYLASGEEGSDFCLLDARSVLYLPLAGGRMLLYIVGQSAEAFSPAAIEAAWRALSER